ncbi:MAG: hypothetical protein KF773_24315 [Deltaproteobacteria bacterium]|nr:hypothetical protein [Deltaproteobacteria bacterium]
MMFTKKRVGYVAWTNVMTGVFAQGTWANNKNFSAAAGSKGCKSIITSDGVSACTRISDAKDAACNRPSTCELDRQERWAKDYSDPLEKHAEESDKERYKRELNELYQKLENGKTAANAGVVVARECVSARQAVQDYFEKTAIH